MCDIRFEQENREFKTKIFENFENLKTYEILVSKKVHNFENSKIWKF